MLIISIQRATGNFHRGKGVDVHAGKSVFDGAQEVAVEEAVEVTRQTALNADFGAAAVPSFLSAAHHFLEGKRVGISSLHAAAKSTKTATDKTDVGEIDVAVDDVSDGLTDGFTAQMICGGDQSLQIRTFHDRQAQALLKGKLFATQNSFQRFPRIGCAA